jgi:hypothetical protein
MLPLQLLSRSHRTLFFFAKANKHVLLVEARDDAFLGLGVAMNAIDHVASDVGLLRFNHDPRYRLEIGDEIVGKLVDRAISGMRQPLDSWSENPWDGESNNRVGCDVKIKIETAVRMEWDRLIFGQKW